MQLTRRLQTSNERKMCNLVEELFSTPIPERVWHYTTVNALDGIISSGRMWATDARFTNDKTEFFHARDVGCAWIDRLDASGALGILSAGDLKGMLAHAFDEGPLSRLHTQVYLICFSRARDRLTQWTQYASSGAGVSIAFDLRYIRPPREAGIAVTFAPCIYDQTRKEQLLASAFSRWTDTLSELDMQSRDRLRTYEQLKTWEIIDRIFGLQFSMTDFLRSQTEKFREPLLESLRRTLYNLLRVGSHCKDAAFFAEQEWRLAMPRPTNRSSVEHPIKFRGKNETVPYFESDLFREERLPIVEVMLGPTCTEAELVQRILQVHGYDCPITTSTIPLRDPNTV